MKNKIWKKNSALQRMLIVVILIGGFTIPTNAVSYRGFVDTSIGFHISGGNKEIVDDYNFNWLISTSHGVQINKLFIGAGVGFMYGMTDYYSHIPIFADVRYDFFTSRQVSFFAGFKIGAEARVGEHWYGGFNSQSGIYYQPSVGFRVRTSNKVGLNFHLSYYPSRITTSEYSGYKNLTYTYGFLALGVGVDF